MIKRDYDPDDVVCGLGIDDGGGFLKLMLMIKPKSIPDEEPVRKRRSYEEAFCTTGPARFKAGGQNKILIVSLIPTCERYDNLAPILDLMGIGTLDFGLCADLKLQLIMVGKQNASSKHSCPYCNDASPWLDDNRQSLTIGQLYADYAKFRALVEELGEEKAMKKAKDCAGTVHSKCSSTGSACPVAIGHRDSIQQEMLKRYLSDLLGEPCLITGVPIK